MKRVEAAVLERLALSERFECWNRGEFDAMQEMYTEDAVFDVSAVFTDSSPARGHANMRRFWHELHETWAGLRLEPVEVLDLGELRYVVDLRMSGTGKQSGLDVGRRAACLYLVRPDDGRVLHAQLFPDGTAAITAARAG